MVQFGLCSPTLKDALMPVIESVASHEQGAS